MASVRTTFGCSFFILSLRLVQVCEIEFEITETAIGCASNMLSLYNYLKEQYVLDYKTRTKHKDPP